MLVSRDDFLPLLVADPALASFPVKLRSWFKESPVAADKGSEMATRIVFIVIALGLAISAVWAYEHDDRLRKNSPQVTIGDSNDVVRELLGDPSREASCGTMTPVPAGCNEEYIYRFWYSIFQPEYLVIWFNQTGKVLGEQRVGSHF
jgi:hypothetical protein